MLYSGDLFVRKGQGAMEYLMTYGWALLVIVVVGAALFALGVLNPSTYTQKRCQGFQYFTYQDQKAEANTFTISLVNGPQSITITDLNVSGTLVTDLKASAGSLTPSGGSAVTIGGNVTVGTSGDSYSNLAVSIEYNVTGGIQGNVDRGTCSGTIA